MDLVEVSKNQNRHPWEISRMKNISKICCIAMNELECINICDIGAGDRYFVNQLLIQLKHKGVRANISAVDNKYKDLDSDLEEIHLYDSIEAIPEDSMDFIIMMDVLEHIENDDEFLKAVLKLLKKRGTLIITVPAYQSLFSSHDVFLNHFRRYKYWDLLKLIEKNKMKIKECHYFYLTLFVIRWLQKHLIKYKTAEDNLGIGMWKYSANDIRTNCVINLLDLDFKINQILNRKGFHLPGLSILCIAKK
jgi:SAM-dependent methyltransferase